MRKRCDWCGGDPIYVAYHDTEWGVPEYDSRALYEKLILDGFQAGLSWITILKKRDNFRAAFQGFDPDVIATWGQEDVDRLLQNAGIVRHRGKIEGAIANARGWQKIESEGGFSDFLWSYVNGMPVQNNFATMQEMPAKTPLSTQISKDLKKRGFTFCGPTIVYAFMQACGFFNDHLTGCFRHDDVAALARSRS